MKKIIYLSFLIHLSCDVESNTDATIESEVQIIQIDPTYSSSYWMSLTNKEEVFVGYFFERHSLDFFNLNELKPIKHFQLRTEGPFVVQKGGSISLTESALYFKSPREIVKINLKQSDSEIQISKRFALNQLIEDGSKQYFNSHRLELVLNDIPSVPIIKDRLVLAMYGSEKPYLFKGIYLLDENLTVAKIIPLDMPKDLTDELEKFEGLNHPFLTTDGNDVLMHFPFSPKIFKIDINKGNLEELNVPGKFLTSKLDETLFSGTELNLRAVRYSAQFWNITWDPFRKLFYRIEKEAHFDSNGEPINLRRGDHWINVFDQKFKPLGHFKLPIDHLSNPYITKKGVYFQLSNPDNESELRFAFYQKIPL
jgi:hypothetical protein